MSWPRIWPSTARSAHAAKRRCLATKVGAGEPFAFVRGLYAVVPPGADPESFPVDPCLMAARLTPDAVLSHYTALEFHGRPYAVWGRRIFSTARAPSRLAFRSETFRGVGFPLALR